MFIDTHVHLVPFTIYDQFKRIGLAAIYDHCPPDEMKESIDSLLTDMDKADVDASIAITSCNIAFIDEYSRNTPGRLFVGYLYDSRNPQGGLTALRREVDKHSHLVKCVKTMFPYLGQNPLEKDFFPLYRFCEKRKLPIQFHMGGERDMERLSNPLYFGKLASLFPELNIVCLHAGGGMVETMPLLMNLWPNIYLELEALQLNEAEGSREPRVLRYLLERVDSGRLMFGSDRIFPEEKFFWRVQAARAAAAEHMDDLCWKTANKVYDLGLNSRKKLEAAKRQVRTAKSKVSTAVRGGKSRKSKAGIIKS